MHFAFYSFKEWWQHIHNYDNLFACSVLSLAEGKKSWLYRPRSFLQRLCCTHIITVYLNLNSLSVYIYIYQDSTFAQSPYAKSQDRYLVRQFGTYHIHPCVQATWDFWWMFQVWLVQQNYSVSTVALSSIFVHYRLSSRKAYGKI